MRRLSSSACAVHEAVHEAFVLSLPALCTAQAGQDRLILDAQ